MAIGIHWQDRGVLRIGGGERRKFLQDLITNDIAGADDGLIYAALLSPQGKFLFDFFVFADGDGYCIDVAAGRVPALAQRLNMYKLRADVTVEGTDLPVYQVWDSNAGFADPRDPSLGRRVYKPIDLDGPGPDWDALRIAAVVPETGAELIADDSYILEYGFERLAGVDFKKGCYVGQEVTARMKHKTRLRKGLVAVDVEGSAPVGTEIRAGEKAAGTLNTNTGGRGLAYLRFDRATGDMRAGDATVRYSE